MNKSELISKITNESGLTKIDTAKALDATLNAIVNTVKNGEKVTLVGFGTFSASDRKEREGRNPRTGETIKIPAAKVPKFSAGKAFKDAINLQLKNFLQ